jgi:hypothetical protein
MGKITVKHYLEKRVKPFWNFPNNKREKTKLMYPIYVQIIYNKFSTSKRSKTLINCTEIGFDEYIKTGKINNKEFDTILSQGYSLEKELRDVNNCIKIIDEHNINVSRKYIIELIDVFSNSIVSCLTFMARTDFQMNSHLEPFLKKGRNILYDKFILSFNEKNNLIRDIKQIEEFTKIDLLNYVKDEDFKVWRSILMIEQFFGNEKSFSEFVCSDYIKTIKEKMKNEILEDFEVVTKSIDHLIKEFINYHSNYDKNFDEKYLR